MIGTWIMSFDFFLIITLSLSVIISNYLDKINSKQLATSDLTICNKKKKELYNDTRLEQWERKIINCRLFTITDQCKAHKNQAKWSYDKQTDHQKKAVIQNLNKVKL